MWKVSFSMLTCTYFILFQSMKEHETGFLLCVSILDFYSSKLDILYANDLAVGNINTINGEKVNNFPHFVKVFSYLHFTQRS
jgi:hypothetical protein